MSQSVISRSLPSALAHYRVQCPPPARAVRCPGPNRPGPPTQCASGTGTPPASRSSGVQVAVSQCLPPLFSEGLQPAIKRTRTTRSRASTNKSTRRIYKVQARRCVFRSTSRLIYASRADVLSPPVRVRDHTVVLRTSDLRISRYLLRLIIPMVIAPAGG